jgi:hypothetical protein
MLKRRGKGQWPQIIFTSDFHELVRGDLLEGNCVLRYDPYRIVPPGEIAGLPQSQRSITCHLHFHPEGQTWEGEMRFAPATYLVAQYEPTGQGTMLEIDFHLPPGSDEIECWFSYVDETGKTLWDSNLGSNFWLRFPTHDLQITVAELVAGPTGALDLFELEIESVPAVETITVQWRYANEITGTSQQRPLTETLLGDRKRWSLPGGAPVAWNTPLAFVLLYTVAGQTFFDDNDGTKFVVSK